ncbi:MAG: glycogen synthase GlgA [Planctomycetes bacterium]|nr:glycogen synthase GlgA [Planctomycetota bacterium]
MTDALRILLVSSELTPFAKTGGLADVVAGLGRWLAKVGHSVRIVMPLYGQVARGGFDLHEARDIGRIRMRFDGSEQEFGAKVGELPNSKVPVYFVDCPAMFGRDRIYSSTYADEHIRFGLLCRAALEFCQRLGFAPDIAHCNDWHTALVPLYLRSLYSWDGLFRKTRTLLTIHNIGYQGQFSGKVIDDLGLAASRNLFHQDDLQQRNEVNFLKTGLLYADWLTTVSPNYAKEIQTAEGGRGLEDTLRARKDALTGIVNGVDYGDWDPANDRHLPAAFGAKDLSGKAACKKKLLERFALRQDGNPMVIGIVSRLTSQKGFDLLPDVLPVVMRDERVRLVALGSGEQRYEDYFQWLRDQLPDRVGVYRGYHEELAHWIEAGSDAFLMPSLFEPCGLNQMYSMRYGTVPIVRRTGGLADTVVDHDAATGRGTGFVFDRFDAHSLLAAMQRAVAVFKEPAAWHALMMAGMAQDWSWDRQGPHYVELYRRLMR